MDPIIASLFGSGASALLGGFFGRSNQDDAQSFNAQQFATRYQTSVKDMAAAGLNPMLAYSQGGGAGATSSAVSAQVPDFGATISQARTSSAQSELLKAQTQNQAAQGELYQAQAAKARAEFWYTQGPLTASTQASADQSRANINFLEGQYKNLMETMKNVPKEGNRLDALAKQLKASEELMINQGKSEVERKNQLQQLAFLTMYQAKFEEAEFNAASNVGFAGRYGKELASVMEVISDVAQMIQGRRRGGGITINNNRGPGPGGFAPPPSFPGPARVPGR